MAPARVERSVLVRDELELRFRRLFDAPSHYHIIVVIALNDSNAFQLLIDGFDGCVRHSVRNEIRAAFSRRRERRETVLSSLRHAVPFAWAVDLGRPLA